jgi:hypothetical protein
MRRTLFVLALTAVLFAPALSAQESNATAVPACPSTATLDQLIAAIDAAISGPADKDRICFRQLFAPDARLIPIRIAPDGKATPRVLTVDGWIDAVRARDHQVFYERQIKVRTETWAHLAHLWSTYETRTSPNGKPPDGKVLDRGINSIQAVFDGTRWKVIEILWQAETPADPVSEKYLP